MSTEPVFWQSPCLPCESPGDAARRFVREKFGVDRRVAWSGSPGEFRFADGHQFYRLTFDDGTWRVMRMAKLTPQAKKRAAARREAREAIGADWAVEIPASLASLAKAFDRLSRACLATGSELRVWRTGIGRCWAATIGLMSAEGETPSDAAQALAEKINSSNGR